MQPVPVSLADALVRRADAPSPTAGWWSAGLTPKRIDGQLALGGFAGAGFALADSGGPMSPVADPSTPCKVFLPKGAGPRDPSPRDSDDRQGSSPSSPPPPPPSPPSVPLSLWEALPTAPPQAPPMLPAAALGNKRAVPRPPDSPPPALQISLSAVLPQSPPPLTPAPVRFFGALAGTQPPPAMEPQGSPKATALLAEDPFRAVRVELPLGALRWTPGDSPMAGGPMAASPTYSDGEAARLGDSSRAAAHKHAAKFPPGLSPPAGTPSHGSVLHGTGQCRPCAWFWKAGGCQNAEECCHCHLCPVGEIKARKKAKQGVASTPQTNLSSEQAQRADLLFPTEESVTCQVTHQLSHSDQESTTGGFNSERESDQDSPAVWEASSPLPGGEEFLQCPPGLGSHVAAEGRGAADAPSVGSRLHGTGRCRPCAWYWKPGGCQNAGECLHCHSCLESELKSRKKNKMAMMRLGLATPVSEQAAELQAKQSLSLACLI